MNEHRSRILPLLLLGSLAVPNLNAATAANPADQPAKPSTTYPQIVRVSYVEGDVRISRGKLADKLHGQESGDVTGWEQATANTPIESGSSLVTGDGRAEIELEDASTVYLAGNCVLEFGELSSTGGVPYTEMSLLSGTATLDIQTLMEGERLELSTPTDHLWLRYPQKAYMRVESYLDAVSVTPLKTMTLPMPGFAGLRSGQTFSFRNGQRILTPVEERVPLGSDWDKWVAARVDARDAAVAATMKDAGLGEPIPGLAEMNGQGTFFACEPYGTCWQPAKGWNGQAQELAMAEAPPAAASGIKTAASAAKPARIAGQSAADAYLASHPGAVLWTEDYTFPCSAYAVQDLMAKDPVTGKETVVESHFDTTGFPYLYPIGYPHRRFSPFIGANGYWGAQPWDWGVCHAGSWIRWHHRYAWVASRRRHHEPPVRWVKRGRTVGFVPLHPRDVAGKPPLNLKSGLFILKGGKSASMQRVDMEDGKGLKLLEYVPKEFRKPDLQPLKAAETPRAFAHSIYENTLAAREGSAAKPMPIGKGTERLGPATQSGSAFAGSGVEKSMTMRGLAANAQGTPISFDRKQQSFSVARPVMEGGGRTTVVAEPLGGRGASYPSNYPSNNPSNGSGYGSQAARNSNYGGEAGRVQSAGNSSYGGNGASASRASTPAPSYNNSSSAGSPARSYSAPAPSYSAPAPSYSAPAPSYSAPPAPSSNGSSGASPHK